MAEVYLDLQLFADGEDKTEEPTPHRLREARKRGQVVKSMEVNAAVNLLGMVLALMALGSFWLRDFRGIFYHFLRELAVLPLDSGALQQVAGATFRGFFNIVAPLFAVALVLGLSSNFMQIGFLTTTESISPKLSRLNPLEGIKRIFSQRALFELVKALVKVVVVSLVVFFYLRGQFDRLVLLINQEATVVAVTLWDLMVGMGLRVGAVFAALAVLDYLFQRREFMKQMRMTRRELKDEYKQMEGDPHLRAKLREKQRYFANQRMLQEVPEATVVVTNPTELAAALRYDEGKDEAPVLLAKGAAALARRIREIASEHGIPVVENKPVARLLFRRVEVGEAIPVDMYQAVAEILAVVYRLQERGTGGGRSE